MEIRKTTKEDIPAMMVIVENTRQYFKDLDIDQWQNGYPNEELFLEDIKNEGSYVLTENGEIYGFCYIGFHDDPNYVLIEDGAWLNNEPYGVIHRIAIREDLKGNAYASLFFQFAEQLAKEMNIHNIRVDTHEKNASMLKCIHKNGFVYCGIVYMEDHSPRVAYQKVLID